MTTSPDQTDLEHTLQGIARAARREAPALARAPAATRTACLVALAGAVRTRASAILDANQQDVTDGETNGLSAALLDRLALDAARLEEIAQAVEAVAEQSDPVGSITERKQRPNGLEVTRVRSPLGVILMIYESRPNVTIDAAALCLRSGNAAILRGGSEAKRTNAALAEAINDALDATDLPRSLIQCVPTQDRRAVDVLLTFDTDIDLVIPRGGPRLITHVAKHSRIPVVQHYQGICHVYVDASADLEMAQRIVINAKTQRPGVCNAMETLLVHAEVAEAFLPKCLAALSEAGTTIVGCATTQALYANAGAATEADFDTEFLDLKMAVRVVDDVDAAIAHIDRHGSHHTASIVAGAPEVSARFTARVDASCVLVNASTRFNDGAALGLGAEMGISTTKVHAYGPMGAESLCTERFVVHGTGQVR